jgi:hypothetical protein
MKYGSGLRRGTVERLKAALVQDPSIVTMVDDIEKTEGLPEAYLIELGFTVADLKRLERHGFAARGYRREKHIKDRGTLHKRWILIGRPEPIEPEQA